jgi:three-Cys-motif partner protein
MAIRKDVKNNMQEHSKVKVELYGSYLAKYLNIIANDKYTKKIHIYDLFCGPGVYENGGKGSPIIALETIQANFGAKPYFCPKMKVLFNDNDSAKVEKLQQTVTDLTFPGNCEVHFSYEEYKNILIQVIKEIETFNNEKGIVFIDPYGYKDIKLDDIKALLSSKKVEVLLFLPSQFMFRFANSAKDDDTGGKEPLHIFIIEIFNESIPEFKSAMDFIEHLKNGFKQCLTGSFVDTFTLEREKGQFFALFFFTNHIKGFEKMLETKWELDEQRGKGFRYEKSGELFSSAETNDLEGKLEEYLKSGKRYNGDVYEFTMHHGFLPKHTSQIMKDWMSDGKLTIIGKEGESIKKGAFYLNYKMYTATPNKIHFKLT